MSYKKILVTTRPYDGQKPGTSGLRKPTKVFLQENYSENFVQAILNACIKDLVGKTDVKLVVGGDGRYFVKECLIKIILPLCAANGVNEVIVGQNGLFSTPAASNLIIQDKCNGGILLTASHNPGGINEDFGIKYNCENGGPAPEKVTEEIYLQTKGIKSYMTLEQNLEIDICKVGTYQFSLEDGHTFKVKVINSTDDYTNYMKTIFDFSAIRGLITNEDQKSDKPFKLVASGMHGVMGPYIKRILGEELGVPAAQLLKCEPLEDFGGHHPDPNLTYAADLVDSISNDPLVCMGCAFDGDGDRNMIIGRGGFFVSPCDSLAVIADQAKAIKYFRDKGITGFARSMPTSRALDKVCEVNKIPCYEVPTGWKFFGNLMDANLCCLCGEESFGTGSDHVREKDGMWAVLAWLNILAERRNKNLSIDLENVLKSHWSKFGRHFFTRYDYEGCTADQGYQMMTKLEAFINDPNVTSKVFTLSEKKVIQVMHCDNYSYTDPVDNSISAKQGIRIFLSNGARLVYRLSGTGSSGATVRLYVDCYEEEENQINRSSQNSTVNQTNGSPSRSAMRRATVADPHTSDAKNQKDLTKLRKCVQMSLQSNEGNSEQSQNIEIPRSHSISGSSGRRRVSFGELPCVPVIAPSSMMKIVAPVIPERLEPGMNDGLDASGSVISVTINEYSQPEDRILDIGLGMLGQYTIYEVLMRLSDDGIHKASKADHPTDVFTQDSTIGLCCGLQLMHPLGIGSNFNPGLHVEIIKCCFDASINELLTFYKSPKYQLDVTLDDISSVGLLCIPKGCLPRCYGHELVFNIKTGNVCRITETYYLCRVSEPNEKVTLVFRATALGKNHGTPSLHVGIHKLGHTPEYEESDVQTEWQNVIDDDEGH